MSNVLVAVTCCSRWWWWRRCRRCVPMPFRHSSTWYHRSDTVSTSDRSSLSTTLNSVNTRQRHNHRNHELFVVVTQPQLFDMLEYIYSGYDCMLTVISKLHINDRTLTVIIIIIIMLFFYSPNSHAAANWLSNGQCPNGKTFSLDLNVSNDMSDNCKSFGRLFHTEGPWSEKLWSP